MDVGIGVGVASCSRDRENEQPATSSAPNTTKVKAISSLDNHTLGRIMTVFTSRDSAPHLAL